MIRRDYILRMIEEFIQAIARLRSLKQTGRWDDAAETLDAEFKRLLGEDASAVGRLSETELLARLMQEGPTHVVQTRTLLLTTLLKEAGDVAVAEDRLADGRECYLKALHLLLHTLAREDDFECPEFVPKVEILKAALRDRPLPTRTHALLMQHYERLGEFARAEDELFAMLEAEPDNRQIADFGIHFYRRLQAHNDATLAAAGLPRTEVEEGLRDLQNRQNPGR